MKKPPLQFDLKAMFAAITAAAVLLWVALGLWRHTLESSFQWAVELAFWTFWLIVVVLGAAAFEVADRLYSGLKSRFQFGSCKRPPDA